MQRIILIAAMSENRVIGRDNEVPWYMPADLEHFRRVTAGYPFIMGRMSYLSKDRLLSSDRSIILTHHTTDNLCKCCQKAESLGEALSILSDAEKIFILGGGQIFRQSLAIADYMYLTIIHTRVDGDTYFPEFDSARWKVIKESHHSSDILNPFDYTFREYSRG